MSDNPIVTIPQGKLKGKVSLDYNGKYFNSFQGIPYAKPPLERLRFKPPQPPEKWLGIRDATEEGPECYSRSLITNQIVGSEDCLYLNVYSPQKNNGKLLPVMFWIHGGGFVRGSGGTELCGPEYLVAQDVVLVTINYRLGPLGFLSFPDSGLGVTGNAGLKDIVMALKWAQKNIKYFSGDPKNVTIFGESAGGAAVHYLILSPMAKGLFHKAILQSGCALNCFARGRSSSSYDLAHQLGIDCNDDNIILSQLQDIPVKELFKASEKILNTWFVSHRRPFCPVIEPKSKEPAFLTEEPLAIIKSGRYNKVPLIIGSNSLEGVLVYSFSRGRQFPDDRELVPNTMNLRIGSAPYTKVVEEIKQFYGFPGSDCIDPEANLEKIIKIYTHNFFTFDICRSAKLHCENNKYPVYLYRFNMDTTLNLMKIVSKVELKEKRNAIQKKKKYFFYKRTKIDSFRRQHTPTKTSIPSPVRENHITLTFVSSDESAAHADDLNYLFSNILLSPPEPNSLEDNAIRKMTKLWSNFAKYGNPTPSTDDLIETLWEPAAAQCIRYLRMENDGFRMDANPDQEFIDFWEKLFEKHQVLLSKL